MSPAKKPAAKKDHPERARIVSVAAQLFARNGYHGTGVAELGDAVGLGRGALYHYIGSKEELLVEISIKHVQEMVDFGEQVLATDDPAPTKVRELGRRLLRTIADSRAEVTVFFREVDALRGPSRRKVLKLRERYEQIWIEVLDQGVRDGHFRTADPLIAKGLLGLHNYSYVWLHEDGSLAPEQIADLFCDLVLGGLLTEDARAEYLSGDTALTTPGA